MAKARARKPAIDVEELLARARMRLESDGFVRISALGPKATQGRIAEELRKSGFELTKSLVRRPLRDQLLEAAAAGAFVPVKSLTSFVRGGTATEGKRVAEELVKEGQVAKVLRGNAEVIVPGNAPVYSREELTTRRQALDALGKMLAKTLKQRNVTLLRTDLLESLTETFPEFAKSAPHPGAERTERNVVGLDLLGKLFAALDATRDETHGLSFIPKVVAHLRSELPVDAARASLLDAAERGLVELRPEGGLNRLSREELELCLPGPHGTRLSWARRMEGRTP